MNWLMIGRWNETNQYFIANKKIAFALIASRHRVRGGVVELSRVASRQWLDVYHIIPYHIWFQGKGNTS